MVATTIYKLVELYSILLVIKIVLTWLPHNYNHPLVLRLNKVTDPYLDLFRQLHLNFGGMDFSPIVGLMVLNYLVGPIILRVIPF